LFDLAQKFNTFYNKHKVIGSESEEFRLILCSATAQVLENGLKILGIATPQKM
jgi:arginyl-tRNA synthetase